MVQGIQAAGDLRLAEISRELREDNPIGSTIKRLSMNLDSDRFHDTDLLSHLLSLASSLLGEGEGVSVAVDDTDIQKPYAQPHKSGGMQYACKVRDGSDPNHPVRYGWPVVAINARRPDNLDVPLAFVPYSWDHPNYVSQNRTTLDVIDTVRSSVPDQAIWTFDRGYASYAMLDGLDSMGLRWAIRFPCGPKEKRKVAVSGGKTVKFHTFAHSIQTRFRLQKRRGKTTLHVGFKSFRFKPAGRPGAERTLITIRSKADQEEPVAIAVNKRLRTVAEVLEYVRAYGGRWGVEDVNRRIKDRLGFGTRMEGLRVRKFRSVTRLLVFVQAVQIFLALLQAKGKREMLNKVLQAARVVGTAKDISYRLFAGLRRSLRDAKPVRRRRRSWRKSCLGLPWPGD